jgi:RNA polymerase sigma-70 factor, ECF subfamily
MTTGPFDEHSDEEVLARFVDDQLPVGTREAAFHTLVDRYHRRIFGICFQVLRSRADAEDATQETFVKLARGAAGFRGDAQLSTWLYRVARNVCTDHVRHDARRPAIPVADPGELAAAPSEPDTTAGTDEQLRVAAALETLDPLARQALVLVAIEGLSYAEAAIVTDLPVGTVKSRVSRARARLATVLERGENADGSGATPSNDRTSNHRPTANPTTSGGAGDEEHRG